MQTGSPPAPIYEIRRASWRQGHEVPAKWFPVLSTLPHGRCQRRLSWVLHVRIYPQFRNTQTPLARRWCDLPWQHRVIITMRIGLVHCRIFRILFASHESITGLESINPLQNYIYPWGTKWQNIESTCEWPFVNDADGRRRERWEQTGVPRAENLRQPVSTSVSHNSDDQSISANKSGSPCSRTLAIRSLHGVCSLRLLHDTISCKSVSVQLIRAVNASHYAPFLVHVYECVTWHWRRKVHCNLRLWSIRPRRLQPSVLWVTS